MDPRLSEEGQEEGDVDIEIEVDETTVHLADTPSAKLSLEDFEILGVLGRGAYGKVFQVRKISSGLIYAMKVLRKRDVIKQKVVTHANAEKMVLTEVNHPFIVGLAFAFQTPAKLYLVMEYVGGGELFSRLDEVEEMEEREARFYACEVLLALEHLHAKDFVYRDLKPENILIRMNGHICLADFGFAKKAVLPEATKTFCGTVHYMAPEIINKKGHGKSVDWWSLGILIFEMLTGETPFHDSNRKVIQQKVLEEQPVFPSHVSELAKDLITKLLNKSMNLRLGFKGGAEEVKAHPWFKGADWNAYLTRKVKPPFVPAAISVLDTSNFDSKFTQEAAVDSPPTPALEVPPSTLFKGFSYTAPSPLLLELPGRGRAFTPLSSPNLGPSALSGLTSPATRAMMSPGYRSMMSPNARTLLPSSHLLPSPGLPPRTPNGRNARDAVSPTAFLLPSGVKMGTGNGVALLSNSHINNGIGVNTGGGGSLLGSPYDSRVVVHSVDASSTSSSSSSPSSSSASSRHQSQSHTGLIQNLHAQKKLNSPTPLLSSPTSQATTPTPITTTSAPTTPTTPATTASSLSSSSSAVVRTPHSAPTSPTAVSLLSSNFTADIKEDYFELRLDKQKKKRRPKKPQKPDVLSSQLSRLHLQNSANPHGHTNITSPPLLSNPSYAYHQGHASYPHGSSAYPPVSQHYFQQQQHAQHQQSSHATGQIYYATHTQQPYGTQNAYPQVSSSNYASNQFMYYQPPGSQQPSHSAHVNSTYPHGNGVALLGNGMYHGHPQASSHHHSTLPQPHVNPPLLYPTNQPNYYANHAQHTTHLHSAQHTHQPPFGPFQPQEPTRQYGFRVLSATNGNPPQPGVGPSKTLSHILRPQIKQSPLLSQVDQDVHVWTEVLNPSHTTTARTSILSTLASFPKQ